MKDRLIEYGAWLESGEDLSPDQVLEVADLLISESIDSESKEWFLEKLSGKGETNEEFSSFVSAFRNLAKDPNLHEFSDRAIDLCGTGGDRSGSFNLSTFVSILVAAGGVPVIKHGNRSISSRCGSADLLEALGIPLETESDKLRSSLESLNFCFLFAPHFHPAFKHLVQTRKALAQKGVITMFNRLGPCLNPARPAYQLLGVYDPDYLDQIAHTLESNGGKSGWVVHGIINPSPFQRMDELTACGPNLIRKYGIGNSSDVLTHSPEHWGQSTFSHHDLSGGSLKENLSILDSLLSGDAPPGLRASVLINASSAFLITGKVGCIEEGVSEAERLLDDGTVARWLEKAKQFFLK